MKLIAEWKTSYKLYSVQIGLAVTLISVLDGLLRLLDAGVVPGWVFWVTGPALIVARNVQQFLGDD